MDDESIQDESSFKEAMIFGVSKRLEILYQAYLADKESPSLLTALSNHIKVTEPTISEPKGAARYTLRSPVASGDLRQRVVSFVEQYLVQEMDAPVPIGWDTVSTDRLERLCGLKPDGMYQIGQLFAEYFFGNQTALQPHVDSISGKYIVRRMHSAAPVVINEYMELKPTGQIGIVQASYYVLNRRDGVFHKFVGNAFVCDTSIFVATARQHEGEFEFDLMVFQLSPQYEGKSGFSLGLTDDRDYPVACKVTLEKVKNIPEEVESCSVTMDIKSLLGKYWHLKGGETDEFFVHNESLKNEIPPGDYNCLVAQRNRDDSLVQSRKIELLEREISASKSSGTKVS